MRRPSEAKRLYIGFEGFLASCEEQANPALHGRPFGKALRVVRRM